MSDGLAGFGLLQDGTFCFVPWCGTLNDKRINTTCSCLELCFSVLNENLSLDFSQKIFYVFKLFLEGSCLTLDGVSQPQSGWISL